MNVLEYLSQKKNDNTKKLHPFIQHSAAFRYTYSFGLAVLVYGYKDQHSATLDCFSSILDSLHIDAEQRKKLPIQVKNYFDLKITDVFSQLVAKDEQYCFISDLYRLEFFGLLSPTFCHDIIEGYTQVFNFSQAERIFLQEFTKLGFQTSAELQNQTLSYYDTKLETATELYQNFKLSGYDISTTILEYIYPAFSLTNEVTDLILDDGSIQRFESNLRINGSLLISNCSTIVIDHADVKISGNIQVRNGKIIIRNSHLFVEDCSSDYLFDIQDAPSIRIENSTIDCNDKTAFITQNSGHLKQQHSQILNTIKNCSVYFTGNSAEINTSTFQNCAAGAIFNNAKKELFLASCTFNNCHNVHGGAIHSRSLADTIIYNCDFHNCHAQYLGGAVYFVNLKYGQSVIHCTFENCTPSDNTLFNAYETKTEDLLP